MKAPAGRARPYERQGRPGLEMLPPSPPESEPVLSDAVVRMVEKRAAVIDDDVERLRFVRRSLASHAAAARRRARFLRRSMAAHHASRRRVGRFCRMFAVAVLMAVFLASDAPRAHPRHALVPARANTLAPPGAAPNVWLVEWRPQLEIYSNGLRIENEFLTATRARAYRTIRRDSWQPSEIETQPAGIVFHTTESRMAPFDPTQNSRLRRNGRNLLEYVAQHRFYHFLIDRFGRVYRVVAETDYANHAGRSIWIDERNIYWNLNLSFLGVAFEAQTEREAAGPADIATPAQIDAARVLTEMLRSKYHIAASNCVTHAQVSINPQTMRLGYHTDWAANFPFREIGLGQGYDTPVAAIPVFGFDYDSAFLEANGGRVWPGLVMADEQLLRDAAAHGATFAQYRRQLQQRFREWKAAGIPEDPAGDRP
ncbi:MAG TPA: peptidoglycan recognition family protein [Bryobacteraceae bacterium]|nr:peptidoglycan recognition family protein [Bryobacteraceae bacterium]